MKLVYAIETAEDYHEERPSVSATVTFEFDDKDNDGDLITEERAREMAGEVLHDGRTSSTTYLGRS